VGAAAVERFAGVAVLYFESMAALWAMDGHGIFVWSSYAVALLVVVALLLLPMRRERRLRRRLQQRLQREAGASGPGSDGSPKKELTCTP
jgi:heme exporter protein D